MMMTARFNAKEREMMRRLLLYDETRGPMGRGTIMEISVSRMSKMASIRSSSHKKLCFFAIVA